MPNSTQRLSIVATLPSARGERSELPQLAARARAVEGLAMVDNGLAAGADLLHQAEPILLKAGDWLWVGRIQGGLGRAALDEGCYQLAYEHWVEARDQFRRAAEPHEELGWAHFHIGCAQRLMALRLACHIDANAEKRRCSPTAVPGAGGSRQRLQHLRSGAEAAFADSEEVFRSLGTPAALDAARLERSALWSDCGDLERASLGAHECYVGAMRRRDAVLMGQARLLQCRIEITRCEEEVGPDLPWHAERADEYVNEALALALRCDAPQLVKRRLLGAIYVAQGLLFLSEFFDDADAAGECCRSAGEYVNPAHRDELWGEYRRLCARVRSGETDARLRRWSEGLTEGKTFQQMAEEFAELVIPAVWEREGKIVSRVVAKLAISPKKVRRILDRVGRSKTG